MRRLCLSVMALAIASQYSYANDERFRPENAVTDSFSRWSVGPSAFYFANSGASYVERYKFTSGTRTYTEFSNGTARLRGTVVDTKNSRRFFHVDVVFRGYVAADKKAPTGSPKTDGLKDSALSRKGGPINPDTWHYYTSFVGTLTGAGDMSGWKLQITRRGPAYQVGIGASMYNRRLGASSWFTTKVLSRGSKVKSWKPDDFGDININLTPPSTKPKPPGPKDCIAYYPFDHNSRSSRDVEKCSTAYSLASGRSVHYTNGEACLSSSTWYASSRSSSRYASSYLQITVVPDARQNCKMSHTEICFDIKRDNGSSIRFVDVRADEDRTSSSRGNNFRTILATEKLVSTKDYGSWERVCIDLSKIKALQGLTKPYAVRLHFYGSPNSGWKRSTTCLDNIRLCGKGLPCLRPTISRVMNPTLEFVTSNCFRVVGANLKSVTEVKIGDKVIKSQNSNDFGTDGYFVRLSENTLCVFPPLCMSGSFKLQVRNSNCGDAYTGSATVRFVAPRGNRLATTSSQDVTETWCAFLYGKNKRNYYCVFASPFLKPSRLQGVIDLGIGDNFKLLIAFDSGGPKCWKWCIGKWSPAAKGLRLYFQTLVIDLDDITKLPFEVTNVTSTRFR